MRRDADELEGFLEFLVAEVSHPGLTATVRAVLADCELGAYPRPTTAIHSYAGGLLEHTVGVATLCRETTQPIRGCAPTCCSRPRSCTTSAARSSSDAGRRSPSPTKGACSATCTSDCA